MLYCFCQRTAAVVCLSSQTLGLTNPMLPVGAQTLPSVKSHGPTCSGLSVLRRPAHRMCPLRQVQVQAPNRLCRLSAGFAEPSASVQELNVRQSRPPLFKIQPPRSPFAGRSGMVPCLRPAIEVREQNPARPNELKHVRPNPSIELTCPGKPGHAAHVKR
jgi:hypothetical protein